MFRDGYTFNIAENSMIRNKINDMYLVNDQNAK